MSLTVPFHCCVSIQNHSKTAPVLTLLLEPMSQEERSCSVLKISISLFLSDDTSCLFSHMFVCQSLSAFLKIKNFKEISVLSVGIKTTKGDRSSDTDFGNKI